MRSDPGGPLVTFYDDASGERVELSAVTFDNWVAKTANLLVDGLGLAAGDTAAVVLPMHWQALVVVAGCWSAGLTVALGMPQGAAVAFTAEGWPPVPAAETIVLSLRPMGAPLAAPQNGTVDYAAEIRAYGDRFGGPRPGAHDAAVGSETHAELCTAAAVTGSGRVLLAPTCDPPLDRATVLAAYLTPLLTGGSSVICRHADPDLLTRRATTERATRLEEPG